MAADALVYGDGLRRRGTGRRPTSRCWVTRRSTGYLRFSLPELAPGQNVTGATLRVHTTDWSSAGSTEPIEVRVADNTWDEATVT